MDLLNLSVKGPEHGFKENHLSQNFGRSADRRPVSVSEKNENKSANTGLNDSQEKAIEAYTQALQSAAYSKRTTRSYVNAFRTFLKAFSGKLPSDLNSQEIEYWLERRMLNKKLANAHHNTMISAIQLYFQMVEQLPGPLSYLKRPRCVQDDPKTISKHEVQCLLDTAGSLKNRCLLLLTYAAGLRVMELISIEIADLEIDSMTLIIKGNKSNTRKQRHQRASRVVPLSPKLVEILKQYLKIYSPKIWLFEGKKVGHRYSERSAQVVMQQAASKAGLDHVSLKNLRASYAAHQLEAGISVSDVQDLMGHNSIRTTSRFAHVAKKKMPASPADHLDF